LIAAVPKALTISILPCSLYVLIALYASYLH
jgi:hypothetical protein